MLLQAEFKLILICYKYTKQEQNETALLDKIMKTGTPVIYPGENRTVFHLYINCFKQTMKNNDHK